MFKDLPANVGITATTRGRTTTIRTATVAFAARTRRRRAHRLPQDQTRATATISMGLIPRANSQNLQSGTRFGSCGAFEELGPAGKQVASRCHGDAVSHPERPQLQRIPQVDA